MVTVRDDSSPARLPPRSELAGMSIALVTATTGRAALQHAEAAAATSPAYGVAGGDANADVFGMVPSNGGPAENSAEQKMSTQLDRLQSRLQHTRDTIREQKRISRTVAKYVKHQLIKATRELRDYLADCHAGTEVQAFGSMWNGVRKAHCLLKEIEKKDRKFTYLSGITWKMFFKPYTKCQHVLQEMLDSLTEEYRKVQEGNVLEVVQDDATVAVDTIMIKTESVDDGEMGNEALEDEVVEVQVKLEEAFEPYEEMDGVESHDVERSSSVESVAAEAEDDASIERSEEEPGSEADDEDSVAEDGPLCACRLCRVIRRWRAIQQQHEGARQWALVVRAEQQRRHRENEKMRARCYLRGQCVNECTCAPEE